ncbi:MAG TPA: peptidyl-alpha-hydroxyglycine alpha-amidating lyase family protein [Vicinamibacterales bacterium]|nr:peptidyl-alpha-hydroxyglycine alpha-amidating lyase family protein [Vicinamibacterales bacterium]
MRAAWYVALGAALLAQSAPYRIDPAFGKLPDGLKWGLTAGMAIDGADHVYAFTRAEPPLIVLDRDGHVLRTWGDKLFASPHGARVDRFGRLWLTDWRTRDGKGQQVFAFDTNMQVLMTLGKAGVAGDGPDTFNGPTDVAVAPNGDIFVADGHFNSRIVKFSKNGTFVKAWGRKGTGPGEFDVPHTLAFDSRGRLLVGDRSNKRIQIFDQDGTYLDQWTQFGSPSGIFITADDTIYVVDYNDKERLFIGSAKDGSIRYTIADTLAEGVAVGSDGSIYVGETVPGKIGEVVTGSRVLKFVKQ